MLETTLKPVWWLPTLGFCLVLAVEFGLFWNPNLLFADPGAGRHLRTAEFILETHQIPRRDPLSFTHAGEPWLDYEWAFEATIGELHRVGGLGLVCAFCTAIFAATNLGIYRTLLQSGFSMSVVILVSGLVFLSLHMHLAARPLLFTYLFMALLVEAWQRRRQPSRRDWLVLPVVFIAWANLHAGWAAGLAFLSLAIAGRIIDRIRLRVSGEDAPVIPWIALLVVCLLATSLNPVGWNLHRQIFLYVTSYKSIALLNEYSPPDFAGPSMSGITVLCLLFVIFASRAARRAPLWRWEMVLPVLFFLVEGLKAQRHVLLLIEVAAVPMARDLEVLLHGRWWPNLRRQLGQFQEQQRLAGGDALFSFAAMVVMGGMFLSMPAAQNLQVGGSVKPGLVNFLRDHPDRFQRSLGTTWNAGPLLWDMRPNYRSAFDDRFDFYGDDTVNAYNGLYNAWSGWRETLAKGRFDSAILDNYLNLNQFLPTVPGWRAVYRDDKNTVYWHVLPKPAASPAQRLETSR